MFDLGTIIARNEKAAEDARFKVGREDALKGRAFNPGHTVGTPEYTAYVRGYDLGIKEAHDAEIATLDEDAREAFGS